MSTQILIPLDGSESTEEVLYYTHSIAAARADCKLSLLHILPEGTDTEFGNASAHPCLKPLSELLFAEGREVEALVRAGNPVTEIVATAQEMSASLILMSTHGRSGLERIREGSITEGVVRQAPCPVFILHSERPEPTDKRSENLFQRLLVPLDGSEESARILPCVERFAKAHDAEIVLFHDSPHGIETPPPGEGAEITHTRTQLEEHGVKLANAGLSVRIDWTSYRHPIREILRAIDTINIDLVVMATHTDVSQRHALEESVTADVIRHANCPLMVWSADHCDVSTL